MVIKKAALLLVSIALVSNFNAKALPKPKAAITPSATASCGSSVTPYQFWQTSGMSVRDFCNCFPCLCCDCDTTKYVKKNNDPCPPPNSNIAIKICCEGTPKRIEMRYCCENEEPPCPDCCEECDIEDCKPPNQRGYFHITLNGPQVQNFDNYLRMLSEIVRRYNGKTCCEEYLAQNGVGHCRENGTGYVNACINPAVVQIVINESVLGNPNMTVKYYPGNKLDGCWCPGK